MTGASAVTGSDDDTPLGGTERAVFGDGTASDLGEFLSAWAERRLGAAVAHVRFRAGRIDVVWGVDLTDGRAVVIKIHRAPVDLETIEVAQEAQRALSDADYPCAHPLAGPETVEGRTLTAETLIIGRTPDGRTNAGRWLLAEGLSRHIDILRGRPDLIRRAGSGPSWCRYQDGPWPVPHDTLVDFTSTPPGYEWLDDFGRRAADQILTHRDPDAVLIGHADWYAGNTAVAEGVLIGTFDWELVAETEAVIAGLSAGGYASSSTAGGGLSTPEDVTAFMIDYEDARGERFSDRERRAASGAAAWILAFNARWQVALIEHGLCDDVTVALVRERGPDYLG